MSCPDNAQHLLAQLEDGIPQNVIDWGSAPPADEGTQVVIHRCKCGAFKSPNADCKRCEFLYNNLVQMGADPSTARRLVDEAATSDVGVAQRTIVETLQLSNGEATNLQGAIALYKDHNRRIGANNGTVSAPQTLPGGPNGEHSEATTNSSEEATTAYEQAKKRFLALAGSVALDDADNLAPGYEGLQSLPFYQEFAKAQAAHRQAQGEDIQLSTEMSEGEMRDGKYTVPKRLRTSVEAVGLPKEQANILAQRFNKIGKESARRQSQRVQSRVTAILEAEGIDDPARVQQVLDVLNGRQQPQTTSGDGSTSRVARASGNTRQKRQFSDATRQKLREAAAQRSRCKACGAFMGKTECKRCLQLRQALEEVGVAPERLNLVQTQIAGEVREIEREYRQRNRVMMIQESKDYLAEIGRGDLAMPVMQILHQQLGEAPEHPVAAQEVTPDEWVIQGARPFMNRDTFPDLSRCGFEWPEELGWNASDPEQQARNQHQLEVMAALALGSPLSSGVLHAYPGIATDNYNPNDPITEQRINDETKRLNSGEGGVWLIEKHQGNLAYCLDMMKDAVEYGQPVDPNVFHTFHYSIESLRRATPPPAITEHLQARNSTNTTADTALSPTDIDESSPQTGLINCPKCGKFANPETGCQHCGLTAEEMSTMAPENVGPEQPDHEETAEVDTPQPATATLETSAEGDSAFLAATPESLPEVNVDDAPTAPPDTPASLESNKKKPLTPFVVMSKETGYEDGSWTWIQFPEAASLSKEAREEQYRDIFDAMKGRYRFRYSNKRKAWYAKYPISQDDIAALIADNEHPAPKQDIQPIVEVAAGVSQPDNTLSSSPAIETTPPANLPDKEDPVTAVTPPPESPVASTASAETEILRCARCKSFVSPENPTCKRCEYYDAQLAPLVASGSLSAKMVDTLRRLAAKQVESDTSEAGEIDRTALTQALNQYLIDQQVPYADREAALREALLLVEPERTYEFRRAAYGSGLTEVVISELMRTDANALEKVLSGDTSLLSDEEVAAVQKRIRGMIHEFQGTYAETPTTSESYPRYHLYTSLINTGVQKHVAIQDVDTLIAKRHDIYANPGQYVPELEIAAGLEAGRQVTGLTEDQQPFVQAMLRNGYPLEDAVDAWGRLCYYLETPNADPFVIPEHVLPTYFPDDVQDAAYNYIDDQWAEAPSVDSSLYDPGTTPPDQQPLAQTSPFQIVTDNKGQARCANCYAFVSPSDPNCGRCENLRNQVEGLLSAYDPTEIAELIHSVQSIAADPQFVHGEYNAYNTERLDEIMVIERRMGLINEPDERAGFSELVREYLIESGHSKSGYLSDLASQPAATGDAYADVATPEQQTGLVNCPNCGKFANPEVGCQHCGLTAEEWTTKQGEQSADESINQTATGPDTGRNGHITQPTGGLDAGEGQGPLVGDAADNVSGVEGDGKTRRRRTNRHRANAGSRPDDGLDGAGDLAGSVHDGEGGLGVSAERGGLADPGQPATGMDNADPRRRDHRIKPEDGIGEGGFKTKAQQNIEAIKLLKKLEEEDRAATPEEQAILAKYVGWGGIPQCFDAHQISPYNTNRQWANEYNELKALLTPEEWESARASTPNAHYTSPTVVRAIWQALQEMGYDGGNILEPAAGVGNFLGMMPDEIHANSKMYAVELDSISARITKKLYPSAEVRETGYEKSNLPSDYFDIVISNVPFGDYGVHDPTFTGDKERLTKRIHNYYFAKAMDQAKPGGVVAFVTSRYTMDSTQHEYVRAHLAAQADLVGAIRLPNTAFKQNAGTEVTTDVIFLRKRAPGDAPIDNSWVNTVKQEIPNRYGNMPPVQVNEYFDQHPEMMLGTMQATGSMYRDAQPELVPGDKPLDEALQEAVARLPKHVANRNLSRCYCGAFVGEDGVCRNPRCSTNVNIYRLAPPEMVNTLQHGEYLLDEKGVLCRFNKQTQSFAPVDYQMTANGKMPTPIVRAIDCMPLKEAAKKVLALNVGHGEDAEIAEAQAELNAAYDAFVAKHGLLHKRSNLDALADDPQLPLLLSLEHYDTDTKTGTKADIFSKRIINLTQRPAHSDNAEDALLIAVYEGGINWQRMNELTGVPIPELQQELEDAGYVFATPDGSWHLAEEYLSGDVKKKLQDAQAMALIDPRFQRNVDALLAVQPATLQPSDIKLNMGAGWIPPDDVREFIRQLLDTDIPVNYVPETATWYLDTSDSWTKSRLKYKPANTTVWGAGGRTALELIDDCLNQKDTTITKEVPDNKGGTRRETDQQATLVARNMQDKIRAEFAKWVWSDPDRSRRLAGTYNERFNRIVPRQYRHPFRDKEDFVFPGQNPGAFNLRNYQKDAVWRILQGDTTYLAHIVGAGKSATMITASMELKRMGVRNKPFHIMPKHTLEQYAGDFKCLYPGANVLVIGSEDMTPEKRAETLARIATNDWDAILCSQPTFDKVGMSAETEVRFIEQQIRKYEEGITALHEEGKAFGENRKPSNSVKDLEKRKKRLEEKLQKKVAQLNKDDTGLTFEQLGIDQIFVDEAHYAKKLEFTTKRTRVAGLDSSGSARAFNLYMATRYLQSRCKCGRFVSESGYCSHCAHKTEIVPGAAVYASGTPITNTLAEIYTLQRMMDEDTLNAMGYRTFDAWAAQFTEMVTELEMKPSGGGYRTATRMSEFTNVPELLRQLNQNIDWQMDAEKMGLKRPLLAGNDLVAQTIYEDERDKFLQFAGSDALTERDTLAPGHEELANTKEWVAFQTARDNYRKPITQAVQLSDRQRQFIEECEYRADHLPDDPREDNMLKIVTDARKASLDYRLIDPDVPDDPDSKINKAIGNMLDIYTQHPGKTQMVFLDAGTPKKANNPRQALQKAISASFTNNNGANLLDTLNVDDLTNEAIGSLHQAMLSAGSGWSRKGAPIPPSIKDDVQQKLVAAGVSVAKAEYIARDTFQALIAYRNAPRHFDLYNDMKQKLMSAGVPESEIAFIHDAKTDAQKLELFQKVNAGKVRFLLGSTGKMGTGVNAQKRLVALHHIDAPWRPDEVEQREGRILRHGNENKEVKIFRYATEESFDVYMWQTLERKAKFIEQIRNGRMENRHMGDEAAAVRLGYAEMKAIATGDPAVLELVSVGHEVEKLEALYRGHANKIQGLRWKLADMPKEIAREQAAIGRYQRAIAAVKKPADDKFSVEVDGMTYAGEGAVLESGQALQGMIEAAKANPKNKKQASFTLANAGRLCGLPITVHGTYHEMRDKWMVHAVMDAEGTELYTDLGGHAQGDMMKLRNRIDGLEKSLNEAQRNLAVLQERMPAIEKAVQEPFEYSDKLLQLREKQAALAARVQKIQDGEKKQVFDDSLDVNDDSFDEVMEEAEAMFG